ncbi:MAG: hypothetical protein HYW51_02075 [Candidatus Doudnabacteria bacterium]|nr:hypothetical protein [Candidatus Doudnabacteria bacterium]
MSRIAVLEREEVVAREVRTPVQDPPRPAAPPLYRPDGPSEPGDLPLNDPAWQRLDAMREEAGRRGISQEELALMDHGFCPKQIDKQIGNLRLWLRNHPA